MLTFEQARDIAETQINAEPFLTNHADDRLVLVEDGIIEMPYAWIFPYTSKIFLQTRDIMYALGGNAPLFVSKSDGKISIYRTGLSISGMIDEHEEEYECWKLLLAENITGVAELRKLKEALNWDQQALALFRKAENPTLDKGARNRLTKIQLELAVNKIATKVELA